MGRRIARALLSGALTWAGLTACSAAVDRPVAPSGPIELSAPSSPPRPPGDPLALLWDTNRGPEHLARIDPRTLEPRRTFTFGRRRAVRLSAYSPDAGQLLTVTWGGHVRVVDLPKMTDGARFRLETGYVHHVSWPEPDVAIVVTSAGGDRTEFIRFDPVSGEVLDVEAVHGQAFAVKNGPNGAVALLHERSGDTEPQPAVLAVFDAGGRLNTVALEEIGAGYLPEGHVTRELKPALAVRGSKATIVGTGGEIATVGLDDLEVQMEDTGSFFAGLSTWMAPAAFAKSVAGTALEAAWVGPDALMVTGYRVDVEDGPGAQLDWHAEPAGVSILDPETWTARVIDEDATDAVVVGDLILTMRGHVPSYDNSDGIGVRAYDAGGRLVWRSLGSELVEVASARKDTVLIRHLWEPIRINALDLDTGKVLATRELLVLFAPGDDLPY